MHACTYISTYVRMYVCTYLRMYVCTYVRMHVRTYVCMHACMHVCVYMFMYAYIYIYTYVCVRCINLFSIDISSMNHRIHLVMFTNLAIASRPHLWCPVRENSEVARIDPDIIWYDPNDIPRYSHSTTIYVAQTYDFSIGFLWVSYVFPIVFLWFSYGFPMPIRLLWVSYGFPMVFLWASCGFPMGFPWFHGLKPGHFEWQWCQLGSPINARGVFLGRPIQPRKFNEFQPVWGDGYDGAFISASISAFHGNPYVYIYIYVCVCVCVVCVYAYVYVCACVYNHMNGICYNG